MALKTVVKALIRDINKVPTIILNNQNDINLALQLDQGVVIDSETIAYKDNTCDEVKILNEDINQNNNNLELNNTSSKIQELEKRSINRKLKSLKLSVMKINLRNK